MSEQIVNVGDWVVVELLDGRTFEGQIIESSEKGFVLGPSWLMMNLFVKSVRLITK